MDALTVLVVSGGVGAGLVVVWTSTDENMRHLKLPLTAFGLVVFALFIGLTVPIAQGGGPVHEVGMIWSVVVAVLTSGLAVAVLLGACAGGAVALYLVRQSASA